MVGRNDILHVALMVFEGYGDRHGVDLAVGDGPTIVAATERDCNRMLSSLELLMNCPAELVCHIVTADGHRLALWEKRPVTPGAVLILVHGRTWSALPDFDLHAPAENLSLMDAFVARGYWTYALDLRGYGATPRDQSGWLTPNRAVRDVAITIGWVRGRKPSVPVHLLGWSHGSRVAQLSAQRHAHLIDRLVLFAQPPVTFQPLGTEPAGEPPRTANTPEAAESDFILDGAISRSAIDSYVRIALTADPVRVDWANRDEWRALDGSAVTVPTLVISGALDPVATPADQAALFRKIRSDDKECVTIPGAAHAIQLERARGAFINAVDAFLRRGRT